MNFKFLSLLIILAAIFFVICPAEAGAYAQQADTAEKEQITITAPGDGSYYLGEQITFSGTNTDSDYVYLFLDGPNLFPNGTNLNTPSEAIINGDESTFVYTAVNNNIWEYKLETSTIGLDAGASYTVYAVTEPKDKAHLSGGVSKYDTVSITIKRPFIKAETSESNIRKGEELAITGTAEGNPHSIAIWVFGYNYWNGAETGSNVTAVPEDDGSYRYVLEGDETAKIDEGEYIIVVQHSMYNDELDILTKPGPDGDSIMVIKREPSGGDSFSGFSVWGSDDRLRGAEAAEALIEMIGSADIDDTYAMCTFKVEGRTEKVQSQTQEPNQKAGLYEEEQFQNDGKPNGGQSGGDSGFFAAIGNFFAGLFG